MAGLETTVPHHVPAGELGEGFFQPDTLASAQYFDGLRRQSALEPERELVLAMLEDAVVSFQKYMGSTREKEQRIFTDAEDWFSSDDREWIFSFANVCDFLGLDAEYLRKGLARWKEAAVNRQTDMSANRKMETNHLQKGGMTYGRQVKDPNDRGRHTGGRQPELTHRRRAGTGAGARLAAV
jgi:hypothetical protein